MQDVTPPSKPKVNFGFEEYDDINYWWVEVNGEKGTDVYVKQNSKYVAGKWKYLGTLTEEKGFNLPFHLDYFPEIKKIYAGDIFSIRLVDDAGNKSEVVTTIAVKEDCTLY